VSNTELQLANFERGRHFASVIEATADSITMASTDPAIHRRALIWKTTAIPLAHEAALQRDPLLSAIDLWGYAIQQRNYFESGEGAGAFGPQQPMVLSASRRLVEEAENGLARMTKGDTLSANVVDHLESWARDHPIAGPGFARASVITLDWGHLGLPDQNVFGSVATMETTLGAMSNRLSYLNEGMIKQMRWNAELMAGELAASGRVDSVLNALSQTLNSVSGLANGTPDLLDHQRAALFADLTEQRKASLADVDRQRVATLGALTAEREAVLRALSAERDSVFRAITEQRVAVLMSSDSIVQRAIDHTAVVVSRLIWQVALIVAGLIALGVLGALALVRSLKGRAAA